MRALVRTLDRITRVLTLPPIVTGLTVFLLYLPCRAMTLKECVFSEVFLLVIPALAYPAQALFHLGADRRSGQRNAAFVFSAVGYAAGFLWALLTNSSRVTRVLFGSYIFSVIVLLLLNKVFHFKASGHACSTTAPTVLLAWQLSPWVLIPCAALIAAVYVSSIRLGRHTLPQLAAGSATSVAASLASILIFR